MFQLPLLPAVKFSVNHGDVETKVLLSELRLTPVPRALGYTPTDAATPGSVFSRTFQDTLLAAPSVIRTVPRLRPTPAPVTVGALPPRSR